MIQSSLIHLSFLNSYLSYILITFTVWLTYFWTLTYGFVSDDHMGIADYDGSLMYPVDGTWNAGGKTGMKQTSDSDVKKALRIEYGTIWRWLRYHVCGGNYPSRHKFADGNPIPSGKVPSHHHLLSIIVFNITCVVTYIALKPIVGSNIALLSIIFLIVHPCTTQGVAWISGLAYPLGLFWMSLIIVLCRYFYLHPTLNSAVWVIPVFCLLQWLAIHAMFAITAMLWVILLFLGYWQLAALSFLISVGMCFDEIRKIVSLRIKDFKQQHMANSTVLNWRKPIVMLKTFFYYIQHSLTPIRIGLYHTWGFHYNESIERIDWMAVGGFVIFCSAICFFFNTTCLTIKLGILWYIVFFLGFSNIITAQQFVTERYIMISNLGYGLIFATLTQNYFWIYAMVTAGYLVRTWQHLGTYKDELRFYDSNCWNFPKSEVALGNKGVTQFKVGLTESGKETWMIASKMNPNYDVSWINIFYQYKTQAFAMINAGDFIGGINKLKEAIPYLEKALAAKICHFPEEWKKEHAELITSINNPAQILHNELKRLIRLKEDLYNMVMKATTPERLKEIELSITNNNAQINRLTNFVKDNNISFPDPMIFNKINTDNELYKLTRRK